MQTNNSKEKVRQLQNKLYLTAKKCDSRRFHALYDKVYRDDVLFEAWKRVKANKGSSGVDSIKIEDVETMGIEPEKITVIYWGIKHDLFFPQKDKLNIRDKLQSKFELSSPYFLSVSCNAERKRTDVLVRSYIALSREQTLSHDLVLVWGNPPLNLLKEVKNSSVATRIHFLKNISDGDLALLYNGAGAMFFPSSYEGFGLPLLEAMACGVPVITCHNSSLDEIAGNAAIYLTEPLFDSLIDVMGRLDQNTIDTEPFVENGIKRAAQFSWEKTAKETIGVYLDALK